MASQVNLDGWDRITQAPPPAGEHTETAMRVPATAPHHERAPQELTVAERQGFAMSWVAIGLGTFLLLGGLALWASAVFSAGFGGWLVSLALMGVVMLATIVVVSFFTLRPRR